jgi:hypothetical protein
MRVRSVVLMAAFAVGSPAVASAATCLDGYYQCLNDTWDTSGFSRILADLECGARYAGCMRRTVA